MRKKLTSPVLLLIHSIPVRDRIDSEHDFPNCREPRLIHEILVVSYQNNESHLVRLLGR